MARPNLSYLKNVILVAVGIPCGFLTGVSGIGSTSLVGTGVRYLLGLRDSRANGAALLTTFTATLGCLIAYTQHHSAYWLLALVVTVGQILGAAFGQKLRGAAAALAILRPALALLVVALGLYMMFSRAHFVPILALAGVERMLAGLGVGVIIGIVSSILEIGGVLTVPAAMYILGLPVLVAQGLSILVLLFASLPAALIYLSGNAVEARSASWIPFGALFGAMAGAYYATSQLTAGRLIDIDGLAIALFGLYHLFNRPAAPAVLSVNGSVETE